MRLSSLIRKYVSLKLDRLLIRVITIVALYKALGYLISSKIRDTNLILYYNSILYRDGA